MTNEIKVVGVIGAGTMGAGIAAQAANAGANVVLLDIKKPGDDPNAVVKSGLERIAQSSPPLLMEPDNLKRIRIGNIRDNIALLADCDWIVEAVVEQLAVKQALYREIVLHLKPGALVSSNTSTIPISHLMNGMPPTLKDRFCITHFFNPVRYMRLLELVGNEDTPPAVLDQLADYCDQSLGKGVVRCADTPGFLGNRVGVFAMQAAIFEATRLNLPVDAADAVFGRPMGIPKTGAFGLYDLIGLDLMADVVRSLRSILPADDAFHELGAENPLINSQIDKGFTGRKGKGGFYAKIDGKAMRLDLATGEWLPRADAVPELAARAEREGLDVLLDSNNLLGEFARNVLIRVLSYSASLIPSVTHSPQDIDDAMKLGYNWVRGPFELIDEIGAERLVQWIEMSGRAVPDYLHELGANPVYRVAKDALEVRHGGGGYEPIDLPPGVDRFHLLRRTMQPVAENDDASLFHFDDGLRLVEFHSKANALDAGSMAMLRAAAEDPGPGIIVHNDAQQFSAGVNLHRFLSMIDAADWQGIDAFLIDFQSTVAKLRDCPVPVVGAPSGLALGGGYEVLAHCDCIVAHANSVMGLVETVVGLVPGGGGVKETYRRWHAQNGDWEEAAFNTFIQIGFGKTGSSPALSAELGYFDPTRDRQVMNRDRLLAAARQAIAELTPGYRAAQPQHYSLAGGEAHAKMAEYMENGRIAGKFFDHDVTVSMALASIVTGGENSQKREVEESALFAAERAAFIDLAKTSETRERIAHLLTKGSPLRN